MALQRHAGYGWPVAEFTHCELQQSAQQALGVNTLIKTEIGCFVLVEHTVYHEPISVLINVFTLLA